MLDDTDREDDLGRRLQEAAGPVDEPAALVARSVRGGRRRLQRRRGAAGAGAVVVLGAALAGVANLPGGGAGRTTLTPAATATPAPPLPPRLTTSEEVTPAIPLTPEQLVIDARATELSVGVNAALAAALPGFPAATGGASTIGDGELVGWFFTAEDDSAVDAEGRVVQLGVDVSVVRTNPVRDAGSVVCSLPDLVTCKERTLPDGTVLRSGLSPLTAETDDAVVTSTMPFALAVLPDGRLVEARSSLSAVGPDATDGDRALPLGHPLTVEALEQLVTSPELAEIPTP